MKVAITGKGGAGKTTVAGVLARTMALGGLEVVAVDADPNPNLRFTLGLGDEVTQRIDGIVNALMRDRVAHRKDHEEGRHDHDAGHPCQPPPEKSAEDLVTSMGVTGPDGVVLVETGVIERPADGCLCCGTHATTRRIFTDLQGRNRAVVADLEAGVNDLIWARPTAEDVVVLVTEPYRKSLEVARRAAAVSRQLGVGQLIGVANRLAGDGEADLVRQALPGMPLVEIPDDDQLRQADREGLSPLDAAPESPAVQVIRALAANLVESRHVDGRP